MSEQRTTQLKCSRARWKHIRDLVEWWLKTIWTVLKIVTLLIVNLGDLDAPQIVVPSPAQTEIQIEAQAVETEAKEGVEAT